MSMELTGTDSLKKAKVAAYPLSPLQQGMLFQHLLAPASGVDIEQMICSLPESIDVAALRAAWQRVAERHAILRTGFRWESLESPQQEVYSTVEVPFVFEDWSQLDEATQKERLAEFLKTDRLRGFVINDAPLMRVTLFQMAQTRFELVWTFHHALLDGRSFPIVLREVFSIYEALIAEKDIELPAPRPYRDYIDWLTARDPHGSEKFWRDALEGFTAPTPLVVDKNFQANVTTQFRQGDRELFLSAETTAALETLAREQQLTLNTLLQGAWAILLSRYSGEEDVAFGATRACRKSAIADADNMVGLFINTLPVRVKAPAHAALLPWLRELRAQWVAMRPHEHTPLVKVQSWSQLPPGRSLFESLLVFENYQLDETLRALGGAWSQRQFRLYEQNGFPITVAVYAGPRLGIKIEFDRARFDDATIDRMLGHLETLLTAFVTQPDARLSELPLLTEKERHQLLIEWNDANANFPKTRCLHEWFEAQVEKTPDAVAVVCEQARLTYRELNARANQLAHYLRQSGVGPDVLVGISMDRSLELVVGLLGILKAGGAYLPIDLAYPQERLAFMMEDSQAPVLLTQQKLLANLPAHKAKVICLDDPELAALHSQPTTNPPNLTTPANLAYVIFTSGSTGKPKGALVTHHNVARLFQATEHWFHFNERDVWTLFHSFAFDFSVWELWGALLYGGRLVVVPYLVSRSPEAFYDLLCQEKVTVLNQTPSAFRQLIQTEETAEKPKPLALRYVIFGGEALELQSLKPWFDRHGDNQPRLINMYGITETTVHVTYRPLSKNDVAGGSVIGVPIPDLQIYVLDQQRQPVPIGVPGELFVGGAGLARGYLNRPELTAERFIRNPFSDQPDARLYKTGDRARFLAGRDIEYLGRIDHQVKIRGFRIELGEIESVLCQHPSVREAIVLAREDSPGEKRLVGYLVVVQPAPGINDLRNHLKVHVPDYMVPAAFVMLDAFPLTNNGKIDRKALPVPEQNRPDLASNYVAPRTATERLLAEIWSKVLRLEQIGVHDNYFELGGDSILSIQIISRARQAGLALTPKHLFQHQTIAELSAAAPELAAVQSEQGLVRGTAPLTPIQHWFFEQELAGSDHYNQCFLFTVAPPLDADLLSQALAAVETQHDVLRLRFTRTDSGWRQEFADASETSSLQRFDLSSVPVSDQRAAIEAAGVELQASFDISSGPLWRAAWFDSGANQPSRLLIAIHHLAVDGVSWRILIEDLETACTQLREGHTPQLPRKTTSFKQWAERLTEFAKSGALAGELDCWRSMNADKIDPLPLDGPPHGDNTEASTSTITVALDAAETQKLLQEVPAVYNTQITDALLTALARSLANWSKKNSCRIDLEGHGREDILEGADLSRTVGWFTTIFPVCLAGENDRQIGTALKSIKEQLRQIPQRGIGYGLLRYLAGDEILRAQPSSEIIFNYLGQFDQVVAGSKTFSFAKESTGPWHSPRARRRHLLEVNSLVVDGQLELRWTFSQNFHCGETIENVAQDFIKTLRELIEHCLSPGAWGRTPADFPLSLLDQAALDQLLGSDRNVEDIYPLSPMQQLFYTLESAQANIGFDQWHFRLHGQLDAAALRRAWEQVVQRHSILRTAFVFERVKEPLQVVHRHVELPWTQLDWRGLAPETQAARLTALLEADRLHGFKLSQPPLTRLTLIQLADELHQLVWSHHHLQIDGWSWPLVLKEVSALYENFRANTAADLASVRPYRDYIAWLRHRKLSEDENFWRRALTGFTTPTPVPVTGTPTDKTSARFLERSDRLSAAATSALQVAARKHQVTVSTFVQAAWALLLSRHSDQSEVVFGAAFSGRPAELAGVDSIVGPFVNNLPVRVAINSQQSAADFLKQLHAQQLELSQHQFNSVMEIQSWSAVPWRHRLFDSLLVFQNYVVDNSASRLGERLEIRDLISPVRTNYPLTIEIVPGPELALTLTCPAHQLDSTEAEQLLQRLTLLLEKFSTESAATVEKFLALLPAPAITNAVTETEAARSTTDHVAAQNETERLIAQVWQEAFGLERISTRDNFFDLGGQSLLMIQVHAKLCAALKTDLSIVKMFQYPTIQSLARHLTQPGAAEPSLQQAQNRAQRQKEALARQRPLMRR